MLEDRPAIEFSPAKSTMLKTLRDLTPAPIQ
jgi:hypothetical protein